MQPWIIEPPPDPKLVALATVLTLTGLCTAALTIAAAWMAEVWPDRAGRWARVLLGGSVVEGMLFVAWGVGAQPPGDGVFMTSALLLLLGLGWPALFGVVDTLGRFTAALDERLCELKDVCWWCGHPSPWRRKAVGHPAGGDS